MGGSLHDTIIVEGAQRQLVLCKDLDVGARSLPDLLDDLATPARGACQELLPLPLTAKCFSDSTNTSHWNSSLQEFASIKARQISCEHCWFGKLASL